MGYIKPTITHSYFCIFYNTQLCSLINKYQIENVCVGVSMCRFRCHQPYPAVLFVVVCLFIRFRPMSINRIIYVHSESGFCLTGFLLRPFSISACVCVVVLFLRCERHVCIYVVLCHCPSICSILFHRNDMNKCGSSFCKTAHADTSLYACMAKKNNK